MPPPVAAPAVAPSARFVMVNLSDDEWMIVLTPMDGVARSWRVGPRALREEPLPAGDYAGEQVLLSAAGSTEASRRLRIQLEAGKTYRWRLMTLRSTPAGGEAAKKLPEAVAP